MGGVAGVVDGGEGVLAIGVGPVVGPGAVEGEGVGGVAGVEGVGVGGGGLGGEGVEAGEELRPILLASLNRVGEMIGGGGMVFKGLFSEPPGVGVAVASRVCSPSSLNSADLGEGSLTGILPAEGPGVAFVTSGVVAVLNS